MNQEPTRNAFDQVFAEVRARRQGIDGILPWPGVRNVSREQPISSKASSAGTLRPATLFLPDNLGSNDVPT
jgi:hypothetical protein